MAWSAANVPKGSLTLDSAIMYLQNALVAIQNEISNETRYALLYKFVAKSHISQMQTVFDEMYAKIDLGEHVLSEASTSEKKTNNASSGGKNNGQSVNHGESNSANANGNRNQEESKGTAEYGEMGFKFETLAFPTSQDDLNSFNEDVKSRVESAYQNVIKNVHLYLCYLFLETGDYRNCMKHGDALLS